jgi:hypothetical protein
VTGPGRHPEGQDARAAGYALAADGEFAAGEERRTHNLYPLMAEIESPTKRAESANWPYQYLSA